MLTVVWGFRNRVTELMRSITSVVETVGAVPMVAVDAASDGFNLHLLREWTVGLNLPMRIVESSYRMSLAEAWNLGIHLSVTDKVVIVSSDVEFERDDWAARVLGSPYMLLGNHAVFSLSKFAIKRIGWFDEGFGLGPHFDCDYMIRASEAGIDPVIVPNDGYYRHPNAMEGRLLKELPDRLPMHDPANEVYFKKKWATDWPGWQGAPDPEHPPHPPTHISQVKRLLPEIDPHPRWTERLP
jgi:hypothetical protein